MHINGNFQHMICLRRYYRYQVLHEIYIYEINQKNEWLEILKYMNIKVKYQNI